MYFLLVQTLSENREKTAGKTALEPGDLERGQLLGEKLTRALGERDQAPPALEEASDNRDRAFTLLDKTYSDVQHAVYFLAPDQASNIAPTTYAGGRPPGRKKPAEPEAPAAGGTPATSGTPAAPATPAAPDAPAAPPAVATPPVAPGLPGASPFISSK